MEADDSTPLALTSNYQRARIISDLVDIKESKGCLRGSLVRESARLLDVHPDHVRRMVRECAQTAWIPKADPKTKKHLPDETEAKVTYFKWSGDATRTFEELEARDLHGGMRLRTFQRYIKTHWDSALRACASGGHREMVKRQFFNREHQPYRTYAYGTDHKKMHVQVLPARGMTPIFPWLSVLMDLKTRLIICWVLTEADPVTDDTLALLAEGIRGREVEGRGFVGGLPEFLRTDRGGDYTSKALGLGLVRLDIEPSFTEAYSSFQNGRVERVHLTVDKRFAPTQVGYQAGGEDAYTKRVRRIRVADESLDTLDTLRRDFGKWVEEYNNTPHSSLHGMTPNDAWFSDPHPIKTAEKQTLAHALLRSKTLHLQKYGIDFRRHVYSHTRLAFLYDREVETVEVRYYAQDDDVIEVFHEGEWICTATVSEKQPEHQKAGVVAHRQAQTEEAARLSAKANYAKSLDREEELRRRGDPKDTWPIRTDDPDAERTKRARKGSKGEAWERHTPPDEFDFVDDDIEAS